MRELVAAAGLDVAALKRVRVGGYRLPRELGIGQARALRPQLNPNANQRLCLPRELGIGQARLLPILPEP